MASAHFSQCALAAYIFYASFMCVVLVCVACTMSSTLAAFLCAPTALTSWCIYLSLFVLKKCFDFSSVRILVTS